jgi:hypothetical protein
MTYEEWCKCSKDILKQADEFNNWRTNATKNLLTNIGPRIASLGETGYMGCGFHYDMEIRFGKLIAALAYPWQPCANHCEKITNEIANNIISEVIYEALLEDVDKAEKSRCPIKSNDEA